jgi:putative PIG3 family NAD(P)H quinone oxidoreductase
MKAIVQTIPGDASSLEVGNIPLPEPGPREVLIRVSCSALNRMDLLQAAGKYPVPPGASQTIGVEVSGTIVAMGEECSSDLKVNESVMALLPGGGYAEFCVVDERTVMRTIPGLEPQVSASIPEAFMTAYQLCFFVGRIQSGESVLIHAAASSVGQAAIQMLKKKGAKVFATVRSQDKHDRCMELGADAAIVLPTENAKFAQWMADSNGGKKADAILDPVGTAYLAENLDALAIDGRLVGYGLMSGGGVTDPMFLNKLLAKRISLLFSTLRSRTEEYKKELIHALSTDPVGLPAIASGDIKVIVDRTFHMEEILEAHEVMRKNNNIGKIVLLVTSTATAIDFFTKELNSLGKRNNLNMDV